MVLCVLCALSESSYVTKSPEVFYYFLTSSVSLFNRTGSLA
jgi:hypothetical protein